MFRLHIDIPLSDLPQDAAKELSGELLDRIMSEIEAMIDIGFRNVGSIELMNFRLGHDDDRQKSNHLQVNENGHVSNKKSHYDFYHG